MAQRVVTHHSLRLVRAMVLWTLSNCRPITFGSFSSPSNGFASPTSSFIDGVVHVGCDAVVSGAHNFFDQVEENDPNLLESTEVSAVPAEVVDAKTGVEESLFVFPTGQQRANDCTDDDLNDGSRLDTRSCSSARNGGWTFPQRRCLRSTSSLPSTGNFNIIT